VWGRYAKIKGAKSGDVAVTRQGNVWVVKGRIDSVAPGTEGDWASIDGVVERISAGHVQIRARFAFRIAKVEKGVPCKVGGVLNFRRSGKSQVWRLAEGDNPCDGARENFDLVYESRSRRSPCRPSPSAAESSERGPPGPPHESMSGLEAALRSLSISSRASWSARSFSAWPLWPFTQIQSTW